MESLNVKNSLFFILGIIYLMEFICSVFYIIIYYKWGRCFMKIFVYVVSVFSKEYKGGNKVGVVFIENINILIII